jgi:hypothetical protein
MSSSVTRQERFDVQQDAGGFRGVFTKRVAF